MTDLIEIQDLSQPELDIYARLSEGQLLHINEPHDGIFIAESPLVIERALDAGYEPLSFLADRKELYGHTGTVLSRCKDIPVYVAAADVLAQITGFRLTRGALCAMRRRPLPDPAGICARAERIAVLENVVNPTNVGAIFRCAAALNMDAVLLTAGCSDPLYRRAIRVSMGTVFQIPWAYLLSRPADSPDCSSFHVRFLKEQGFITAAMALNEQSVSIDDPRLKKEDRLALILGTEGEGLLPSTINACDYTVRIPMSHGVDSLNVAAAAAVAFWEIRK